MHGGVVHLWEHRECLRHIVETERRLADAFKAYHYLLSEIAPLIKAVNDLGDVGPLIACQLHDAIEDADSILRRVRKDFGNNNLATRAILPAQQNKGVSH